MHLRSLALQIALDMIVSQSLFLAYVHYSVFSIRIFHTDLGFSVKGGLPRSFKPTLAQDGLRFSSDKNQEYGELVYIATMYIGTYIENTFQSGKVDRKVKWCRNGGVQARHGIQKNYTCSPILISHKY